MLTAVLGVLLTAGPAAALVPAAEAAGAAGGDGAVTVVGEPLVYEFDPARPGDAVTGLWEVWGSAADPVPYEGTLVLDRQGSSVLARALVVEYGQVGPDGAVVAWRRAGTLADPTAYSDALARVPSVAAGERTLIPVRVSLPDPSLVTGTPGETLVVRASFTVSYLGDGGEDRAGSSPGGLAITGGGPWLAAVLAAALVGLGLLLRRRRG